jgi:ABC-2 type transport system permease protein
MTTLELPAPPATALGRVRWGFADGVTVVVRNLIHLRRAPMQLVGEMIFPIVMVLLFGYVFGSAIPVPGGGNYREFLLPGLFAMTAFTSVMATSQAVAGDIQRGVMDRFRAMPMARSAVPFGQTGVDIVSGLLEIVLMACCGLAVGWRAHEGVGRMLAGFALLILMRYAVSWGGVLLGLAGKSEETVDHLAPLIFPLTMIANTFVPTEGMPAWLRVVADWNPVSAVVAACRQLWGNAPAASGELSLPLQHPVAATLIWAGVLLAVFVPLSVRRFYRANR